MASRLPNPQAYEVILGDMLATYMAKIGVNDLNVGSTVVSFFEAMAQAVYRASGDTFAILRDFSVDRAEGEALQRIREEEGLPAINARVATGKVTIGDSSFTKKVTKIYAGAQPPNIGSMEIPVSDASEFDASGSIYIGRGTPNVEGPLAYSSITPVGGYYVINLSAPTTKYHNLSEKVILAQGGTRNIAAGTVVKTLSSGSSPDVNFTVTRNTTLLDGEDTVTDVPVAAQETGTDGNVPRNAIREFVSAPFTGATVTNPVGFITGKNEETDQEIRNRIKKARISRGLGTAIAVKNAVLGAQASDENAVVISDEIFSDGDETTLYIDNGGGYEEKTKGIGLEFIVDSALGGERNFQLATSGTQTSVAKATLTSTESAPFEINPNDRLSILVGGILSEHAFAEGDFKANGFASAYEVVASINANPDLKYSASTVDSGTRVAIQAKAETSEYLQKTTPTVGTDAGEALGLSSSEVETLRLYKNNIPLSRNGRLAVIESANQTDWSNTIAPGDTLILMVDKTQSITYTFTNADFLAEGTHSTVAKTNTLQSWVNVINAKITGVTASINGNRLVLVSNLGTNSRAQLIIDESSTLVSKGMFTNSVGLSANGAEADFKLSRNTAQIKLTNPLAAGDSLTAGSEFTQATVYSSAILGGSVTLPADAQMWVMVDNQDAEIINHGVLSDSLFYVTKPTTNIVRYRASFAGAFAAVQPGDYVVVWSDDLLPGNRLEGRVNAVGTQSLTNDYFELKVTPTEFAGASVQAPVTFFEGLAFLRTAIPPLKVQIAAGSYNINTVAANLTSQIPGATASTENDEIIKITSNNKNTDGSILLFTFNDAAKNLNFTLGDYATSSFSHFGFFKNDQNSTRFPLFIHSYFSGNRQADPPNSMIPDLESAIDLAVLGVDPNMLICMKHPYLTSGSYIKDNQGVDQTVQIDALTGITIDIDETKTIRRVRQNDRYVVLSPLDFDFDDNMIVVLDGNASEKTFPINLYRKAVTNSTMSINANQFRAYDVDAGATTQFSQFFGSSFSFKNYKAMMKAKNVLDPQSMTDEDAILYRSAIWGVGGEKYRVGYVYPTAANQDISHSVLVGEDVNVKIGLKSGAPVVNTIDGTTEWDVTVTPNTPVAGVDEVSYTWNGNGTNPTMPTLAPGHYVTINGNGEFSAANQGTFRVSFATSTSFTVRRPNGAALAENNIATLTTNTISMYENDDTTAQEVVDYVTANLINWITAEIVNDNGTTGAGVIDHSTWEDNDFASDADAIYMLDGMNWISSSTLGNSAPNPQFVLKKTLDLPSYDTNSIAAYAFNNGEELRLIPTTIEQLSEFLSVLAVTGFTTLGEVSVVDRGEILQLATQILGSSGSVKMSGGRGNVSQAQVLGTSSLIPNTDLMQSSISKAASAGLAVGQWLKVQASNLQQKSTGISFTTQVTIVPNDPTANVSSISLANREVADRYFGQPRNMFRDRSRAFHVEKHGSLVNISWDNVTGGSPVFQKSVEFNDAGGGNMSVTFNSDTQYTEYTRTSGSRNFSEVQPGDIATISGFADAENNGNFVVVGVSDDGLTIAVDNPDGLSAGATSIAAGAITITTEIKEGDTLEIGAPFSNLNQGMFRVIRRYENSIYIENEFAVEERVVVASNLRSLGFDNTTQFDVTVSGDMVITYDGTGTTPTLSNAKMGDILTVGTAFAANNQGDFMITEVGSNYIKVANAKAVAQSNITVSGIGGNVLEAHIPSMVYSPYENTRAGDTFVISGNVLNAGNLGTHNIVEVLSKTKAIVSGILTAQSSVQLNNLFVQVYVEEGIPYSGYKKVFSKAVDPANTNRVLLLFDSNEEYVKINEAASTLLTSQGKLGFSETTISGFDSYKHHIGLIAQSNKIVYGDPRDNVTYPGVAAAGAEIFIKPPLVRRITVSINVRVQTGIPFSRITEQVRNNIAALINSTGIGESIAISDIISTVNSIPGTIAISISSPTYDPLNDIIVVNPAEKPFVLDIVNDIQVSKVE
ncbi:MAG TPA: hypothetical protein DDY18_01565 [Flavobacterium sp.]|jgi:hypothetical protein|nr:hypothetical protein [Flavobacterium sp.]